MRRGTGPLDEGMRAERREERRERERRWLPLCVSVLGGGDGGGWEDEEEGGAGGADVGGGGMTGNALRLVLREWEGVLNGGW